MCIWDSWKRLYDRALMSNSDRDWTSADEEMIGIARSCPRSVRSINALVAHGIQRNGLNAETADISGDPTDTWSDHLLLAIYRITKSAQGLHTQTDRPLIMHSIDRSGCLVAVSDAWCEMLDCHAEEALGRPSLDFLTDSSRRTAIDQHLPDFWRSGILRRVSYEVVTKRGRIIPIRLSATAEYDANGNIQRSVAILQT